MPTLHSTQALIRRVVTNALHPTSRPYPVLTRPLTQPQPQSVPPSSPSPQSPVPPTNRTRVDKAVKLASQWSDSATHHGLAAALAGNQHAVSFIMKFTDWVMRAEDPRVAALLLRRVVSSVDEGDQQGLHFLSTLDRGLLRLGGEVARVLPALVVAMARLRMKTFVGGFVGMVEDMGVGKGECVERNVNLLGEAVLGEREARKRRREAEEMVGRDDVRYVSVKVSGVVAQLNRWDYDGSLSRVLSGLRGLFDKARDEGGGVLVNLDMEEYHDLEITVEAFMTLLDEDRFRGMNAGIVLQCYLPDALPALKRLVHWANGRGEDAGEVKIRLVKGANLAMEKVDAAIHGWTQAPYETKMETDANYLRCLDWVLTPERTQKVRIGVASHNLFLLAYAALLAKERGVESRMGFEMLQGMTPAHTPMLAQQGHGMLLYTPVCREKDFDTAISYLFRRFEEASAEGNFLRSILHLKPGSAAFDKEEARFRKAAEIVNEVSVGPRRVQIRPAPASQVTMKALSGGTGFVNEPDTDPCLPANREWALNALDKSRFKVADAQSRIETTKELNPVFERACRGFELWGTGKTSTERCNILARTADIMARRRDDLINSMVFEASKTLAEADPEVSEAIDFANYYGMLGTRLPNSFEPFGVIAVAAPWNFPVAIAAGGVMSALASGNAAILKPSPAMARCAELIAECAWEAGVPREALQLVQCEDGEVGKKLVTEADAVILTGSSDTARLFRSWKKDMRLIAETSGKNSLVISPAADLDLAVADLVQSAFSHSGQKCSASSLAICIGSVYDSERFRRQLVDAVQGLRVGYPSDVATIMGPLAVDPEEKLVKALTELEDGEEWLVKPECVDGGRLWTPGIRIGVKPNSFFHLNEVFGPVLGIMKASDLGEALAIQNATRYGLTGGIHSLDPNEIDEWVENVEVGNAYVNRGTTGAIVQRQCFGGWKESAVGPGAKAGGPNYLTQFGRLTDDSERDGEWLEKAVSSDKEAWEKHFSVEHDPTGLFCETNVFRYRPHDAVAIRVGPGANKFEIDRVRAATEQCGLKCVEWSHHERENAAAFAQRMGGMGFSRVRVLGEVEREVLDAAAEKNVHVASSPVVGDGRIELQHYLREQSISRTRHRFGNLVTN